MCQRSLVRPLNEFDLVPVRVGAKCDDRATAFDRTGLAGNVAPGSPNLLTCRCNIRHAKCNMTVGRAKVVSIHSVVVRELNFRVIRLLP